MPKVSPALRGVVVLGICALLVLSLHAVAQPATPAKPLNVYAAASLTEVLTGLAADFARAGHAEPRLNFAASSVLARQIEAGAGVDVFISADQEWMDYLAARSLIRTETRRDVVGNRLVLVAPVASTVQLKIAPGFALLDALGTGRLATGDPDYVPVGKYAKSALMSLGAWNDVADRIVRADNVRVALTYVARNEVPLGIMYTTDAMIEPRVRVLDTFPADTHAPIRYPVAATRRSGPEAAVFVEFLASAPAAAVFESRGFIPLAKNP
jgi:molybdate transport system substrate-binding protein